VLFGSGAASAQKLDVESIARMPDTTGVSMSAEGDFIVAIRADPRDTSKRIIATADISDVDGTKPLNWVATPSDRMSFVAAEALKVGKVFVIANQAWTGNLSGCGEGRSTGNTKTYLYKAFLSDKTLKTFDDPFDGGRSIGVSAETLRCLEIGTRPSIIDMPLDAENVIVRQTDTDFVSRYSKVSLKTGKSTSLYKDVGELAIDLIDVRDGTVLTKQKSETTGNLNYNFETYILNRETGNYDLEDPLTVDTRNRNAMSVQGYDEETGKYFVVTDKFSDKSAIYLYDARTDKFDDAPLFAHQDFNAVGVVLGRSKDNFGKILGFRYEGPDIETYWTDPEMVSIQKGLQAAFKGQNINIISGGGVEGSKKVLFSVESPRNPPAYYLLLNKTKLLGIGSERPWIKPETLGERSLVYYDARDGLKIPAFLTLPPGFKKGAAAPPAIVLPHGGPWARDYIGWDGSGWTQFFATRGYAVLQPQYRGSDGWGHNLWLAGDGEWGQKMQDDKDDGAYWMAKEGYADKNRIAIFGYSYGGFAAFAASVRADGPFQCAIAGAGVSNLTRIANNWGENRMQRAYQGRTVKGMDPQQNTSKLAMPILIYHGDRDVRVPMYHATDFYNAVKGSGKAKLLVLKDMGHQGILWTSDNHRETLKAMEDFLRNDCKM
jgi:pimeloyl-ACP methyl ester carboxylesterase